MGFISSKSSSFLLKQLKIFDLGGVTVENPNMKPMNFVLFCSHQLLSGYFCFLAQTVKNFIFLKVHQLTS